MTPHPLWLRRFCAFLMVLFDLTEEDPIDPLCPDCAECCKTRRKRKGKL